ncbi:ABC-2 type transporter [Lentilactobacillus parafarraginis F0439]|uniref:ABC-2 type transporter n=1 Tax=Lentilactobacillus parafarraginis F0439 TaxID=797515 RepID=G9ZKG4_9LACO|nr:ABC transporter permease [Lentilactobacillus parafarraginis]EHM01093.1 ABC-2 type transporter [Lentilactobacillus parafarraginis F0439]
MKSLLTQISFNAKRIFLRNPGYLFFTILMPIGFFVLFTKVLISGTTPEKLQFAQNYLGSMIVYSILINALFGLAQIMQSDRHQQLLLTLSLTAKGTKPYYLSLAIIMSVVNIFSVICLELVARFTSNVQLTVGEAASVTLIAVIGTLPLMGLGVLCSFVKSPQSVSVLSNLIVFPLAVISGLWWPLSMMPNWAQTIGKMTPTYMTSQMINHAIHQQTLPMHDMMGIAIWAVGILMVLVIILTLIKKGGEVRMITQLRNRIKLHWTAYVWLIYLPFALVDYLPPKSFMDWFWLFMGGAF